jgi:hypothetical protein
MNSRSTVTLCAILWSSIVAAAEPNATAHTGCSPEERRAALRELQTQVLRVAPLEVASFAEATKSGGALPGWRLSHGLAVLLGSGSVAVDNLGARDPMPQVLLYAPAADSAATTWTDFDGSDGPYRLAGWGYAARYQPGSQPPTRRCIAADEWFVHEAGWHLRDGGMQLTPGAVQEPPRPQPDDQIYFWHPRVWDIHVWRGENGEPTIAFRNPSARPGGVTMPEGAFFALVEGRQVPLD